MSGERLERLEAELDAHRDLFKTVRDYLTTDEATVRVLALEARELRNELGHLERRIRALEAPPRRAAANFRRIEAAHRRHEAELVLGRREPTSPPEAA